MVAYDLHRRSQTGVEETKKKRIRPSKNLDPDSDPLSHHCCQNKAQLSLQMRQNTVQLRSQMRFTEQGRTEFTDADPLSKLCCQNKAQLSSQIRSEQGPTELSDVDPLSQLCCQNKVQLSSQIRSEQGPTEFTDAVPRETVGRVGTRTAPARSTEIFHHMKILEFPLVKFQSVIYLEICK